jgi:hypothetical protein
MEYISEYAKEGADIARKLFGRQTSSGEGNNELSGKQKSILYGTNYVR